MIWYEKLIHTDAPYVGRVSKVNQSLPTSWDGDPQTTHYGLASLNLTDIRESDQGWYSCLVNFLNRSPLQVPNGFIFIILCSARGLR